MREVCVNDMRSAKRLKASRKTRPFQLEGHIAAGPQIISITKARRILGADVADMDDNEVQYLIHTLHLLAKEQLCYSGSKDEQTNHDAPGTAN